MRHEDSDLIERIARGDERAFAELLLRYKKAVYGLAYHLTRSQMIAEDISQETWIRICRNASAFKTQGSASSWILTITRNLSLTEIRKQKKFKDLPHEELENIPDSQDESQEPFYSPKDFENLRKALETLPERQRLILTLQIQSECSLQDLAMQLDLNVNAIKALLFRARENLKRALNSVSGDPK